jgi:hypothetical protein
LADEAQADIGMDYAWLDDVTTNDWTRYHGLKDSKYLPVYIYSHFINGLCVASKKWAEQLEAIFNSKHPDMSENVIQTELMQVETAMMRVAADLKQALDGVRARGEHFFKGEDESKTTAAKVESEEPAPSPPADTTTEDTIPVKQTSSTQKHEEL